MKILRLTIRFTYKDFCKRFFISMSYNYFQDWPVFKASPEIFILIPALLGLKGNLEMTLASRLSTQANLGNLETARAQWDLSIGNISLNQVNSLQTRRIV